MFMASEHLLIHDSDTNDHIDTLHIQLRLFLCLLFYNTSGCRRCWKPPGFKISSLLHSLSTGYLYFTLPLPCNPVLDAGMPSRNPNGERQGQSNGKVDIDADSPESGKRIFALEHRCWHRNCFAGSWTWRNISIMTYIEIPTSKDLGREINRDWDIWRKA